MAGDGYTIGEVLNQLKEEFEDITISKIRFLESEGLIYPDRTESGYRKFTRDDIDRLRFILTAQRDHYLPLKVIREQLDRLDSGEGGRLPASPNGPPAAGQDAASAGSKSLDGLSADHALLDAPPHVALSLREFCEATGLEAQEVRALRDFGIIGERGDEGAAFDSDDVLAGRIARDLLQLGLEARHLRMYRQFVERELALFQQLATPLLRQRNPEARRQATRQLEKLGTMTGQLQRSLLARALRGFVHGT